MAFEHQCDLLLQEYSTTPDNVQIAVFPHSFSIEAIPVSPLCCVGGDIFPQSVF